MSVSDNSNTIRLVIEVTRVEDDSFAIGLEDDLIEGDDRYVTGLSEGQIFDADEAALAAASMFKEYLLNHIDLIAKPMEFKRSA